MTSVVTCGFSSDNVYKLTEEDREYFDKKFIVRYQSQRSNGNWAEYRNKYETKRFHRKEVEFPFVGRKVVWKEKDKDFNLNLQESRGIGINEDTTIDSILESVNSDLSSGTTEADIVRIDHLEEYLCNVEGSNLLEIGFRVPRVQKYYEDNHGLKGFGVDINAFNCELFEKLGFRIKNLDLNTDKKITNVFNEMFDVICCYHVLEHTNNPVNAVRNMFEALNMGGILHIEIPIEGDYQKLEYGHLIGFHNNELSKILSGVGFSIKSVSRVTHTGGTYMERYVAIKE